jgi:hypothetical protein
MTVQTISLVEILKIKSRPAQLFVVDEDDKSTIKMTANGTEKIEMPLNEQSEMTLAVLGCGKFVQEIHF